MEEKTLDEGNTEKVHSQKGLSFFKIQYLNNVDALLNKNSTVNVQFPTTGDFVHFILASVFIVLSHSVSITN